MCLALLSNVHGALRDPVWPLYLGRKSCVPGEPIWLEDGLRQEETLEQALRTYPWLGPPWKEAEKKLRVILEDPDGPIRRPDQPLSFAERHFAPRRVSVHYWPAPSPRAAEEAPCTSHV
ncbi:MAG: type I-E CRISPR-associated protein Cas5/CasD [Anaerolineae bacterium]